MKPTYLIIRSTNHGGLSQNASIWRADLVFSLVGPSSCMPSYSTTTWNPASLFLSLSRFSSCCSYVPRFLCQSQITANFTPFQRLAMLSTMYIHPPSICNHRCKTLVIAHIHTRPLCLPLRRLLVFSERIGTLERCLSNTRQNRLLESFPSWIQ